MGCHTITARMTNRRMTGSRNVQTRTEWKEQEVILLQYSGRFKLCRGEWVNLGLWSVYFLKTFTNFVAHFLLWLLITYMKKFLKTLLAQMQPSSKDLYTVLSSLGSNNPPIFWDLGDKGEIFDNKDFSTTLHFSPAPQDSKHRPCSVSAHACRTKRDHSPSLKTPKMFSPEF